MANEPEWDPKTGKDKPPKATPIRPSGPMNEDTPSMAIGPGSSMKMRTPTYAKGGPVKGCTHHVNKSCKQGWQH